MPEEKAQSENEADVQQVALPIQYNILPQTPTLYANNLLIQHGEHEAFLLFFDTAPPLLVGTAEQMKEQLKTVKYVQANCVARVVVPKDLVPKIIAALQESLTKQEGISGRPPPGMLLPSSSATKPSASSVTKARRTNTGR